MTGFEEILLAVLRPHYDYNTQTAKVPVSLKAMRALAI